MKFQLLGITMMFANTSIGAAVLQLPFRFAVLGLPLALFYFFMTTGISVYFFYQIARITHKYQAKTVFEIIMKTAGKGTAILLDISIIGMLFAIITVYIIVGGDYVKTIWDLINPIDKCVEPGAFEQGACDKYKVCIKKSSQIDVYTRLMVGGLFILESLIGDLRILNIISSSVVFVAVFTVIAIVIRSFQGLISGTIPNIPNYTPPVPRINTKPSLVAALTSIPSFFQLYGIQMSITPIYNELAENKYEMVKKASLYSTIIAAVIYIIFAIFGVVIFYGDNQSQNFHQDNILLIFSPQDKLITVVRIAYSVVILVSFPAILYALRATIMGQFKLNRKDGVKGRLTFYLSGIIIVIFSTIVGVYIPQIFIILDLFGAVFGIIFFMLVPLLMLIYEDSNDNPDIIAVNFAAADIQPNREFVEESEHEQCKKRIKRINILYWIIFCIFVVIGLIGLGFTLKDIFTKKTQIC
ncbi:Amino acid transporter family protein [Spironucleus salmonicida]|uniref:Amino acid transporter family protein n=1 Tax=Spironucleus salmonicida TaxID=348837 RepID=V6LDT0_9EUKA|nr:Amino acid transporter family protein [Spironucleus salmonicida]|eukprot:EST41841.1 Amino acid transporter family protein [Spironucleus salmonicida]